MNTVRSVWYGWASLIVAAGIGYGLAKRSINQDKASRVDSDRERAAEQARLKDLELRYRVEQEFRSGKLGGGKIEATRTDHVGSPSSEAGTDPAATRHAPVTEEQKGLEKSKYAATEVYRSKKGDRFV